MPRSLSSGYTSTLRCRSALSPSRDDPAFEDTAHRILGRDYRTVSITDAGHGDLGDAAISTVNTVAPLVVGAAVTARCFGLGGVAAPATEVLLRQRAPPALLLEVRQRARPKVSTVETARPRSSETQATHAPRPSMQSSARPLAASAEFPRPGDITNACDERWSQRHR